LGLRLRDDGFDFEARSNHQALDRLDVDRRVGPDNLSHGRHNLGSDLRPVSPSHVHDAEHEARQIFLDDLHLDCACDTVKGGLHGQRMDSPVAGEDDVIVGSTFDPLDRRERSWRGS
jgi:hypothetical protein